MSWISLIFYYAFVTAVTGDIMLFIWWLFKLVFLRWNPDFIYGMLRWSVAMFLLPVAFVAILTSYHNSYISEARDIVDNLVLPINFELKYFHLVAAIWFAVTLGNILRFAKKSFKKHELFKGNIPEDDDLAMEVFESMKKELGIKQHVGLLRNDLLKSPIVCGVCRPLVVLPYLKYTEEELRVIFMHELTHIKKHDLFYKALTVVILTIQSFNPVAYELIRLLDLWSEQDCDQKVLERLGSEGMTSKDYFDTIFQTMESDENRDIYIFSMLFEKKYNLERRIEFMNKYGNRIHKASKAVTTAFVLGFMLASTTTAYAAGITVAKANDEVFKATQVVNTVDDDILTAKAPGEFTVSAEQNALVEEVCVESEVMPMVADSFDWNIVVEKRYVTTQKWMSKGTEVTIAVTVSPSDCTYWYGIMHPNGSSTVCEVKGGSSHTFTIPSSGFYRILVENRDTQEIHAVGGYSY